MKTSNGAKKESSPVTAKKESSPVNEKKRSREDDANENTEAKKVKAEA